MKRKLHKKFLSGVITMTIVIQSLVCLSVQASGGDGTILNPYLIHTETDFCNYVQALKNDSSLCARLERDITFTVAVPQIDSFSGVLDGNNHKITLSQGSRAIIVNAKNGTVVKNLVVDGKIDSSAHVAPFIRYTDNTANTTDTVTLENCVNLAEVKGSDIRVAGFVAYVNPGDTLNMKNCYNYGSVIGEKSDVAPIAVLNPTATANFDNCYYLENSAKQNTDVAVNPNNSVVKKQVQFENGEVAFLLGDAFGQKIGEDKYPVFRTDDNKVYRTLSGYSNTSIEMGTVEYPYLIRTKDDLNAFAEVVKTNNAACAKMTGDIDLNNTFVVVGDDNNAYRGSFDGNGYSIKNMKNDNATNTGLFDTTAGAYIKNLTVTGNLTGQGNFGGFAGKITENTRFENCVSLVNCTTTAQAGTAGFSGQTDGKNTFKNCIVAGEFNAVGPVAGLALGSDIADHCIIVFTVKSATNVFRATNNSSNVSCYIDESRITYSGGIGGYAEKKSTSEFESGYVAYLMGDDFGQWLTGDNADKYPMLRNGKNKVYTDGIRYFNLMSDMGTFAYGNKTIDIISSNDMDAVLIIAVYNDDGLVSLQTDDLILNADESYSTAAPNLNNGEVYKVFLWNNFMQITPIATFTEVLQ